MSTGKVRTHRTRAHERGNLLVQYKGDYDNEIQAGYVEIQYNPEVATRLVGATLRLVDSATRVRYPRRRMWSCE